MTAQSVEPNPGSASDRCRLRHSVLQVVIDHAREAAPGECCGILIGAGREITEAVRAPNLSSSPTRFLLDPKTHILTRREARARGLDVIGFYHSHPHSAAEPSPTDIGEASDADALHLIVSLQHRDPGFGVFRLTPQGVKRIACELLR